MPSLAAGCVRELIEVRANQRTKGYWVGPLKGQVSGFQLGFTPRYPFDCVLAP